MGPAEKEIIFDKFVGKSDTLYLVDRMFVETGRNISDAARKIPLTSEEREIVIEAFRNGRYYNLSYYLAEDGTVLGSVDLDPSNKLAEAYKYYMFIGQSALSYNLASFEYPDETVFTMESVGLSDEWREKVNAIIKKYCPDSYPKVPVATLEIL